MDELRCKDSEYSPESLEEADCGSMQETDAEQPTVQQGPPCGPPDDHFPIHESKWETSLPMNSAHKYALGYHISKFVGSWHVRKIARTEKQMRQFIGD